MSIVMPAKAGIQCVPTSRRAPSTDPAMGPGVYWIPALASLRSLGRNDGEVWAEWVRSSLEALYSLHDEEAEVRAPGSSTAG
jgi:hypothetical protein